MCLQIPLQDQEGVIPLVLQTEAWLVKSSGGGEMALPINGPAHTNQNISLKELHFYS